MNATTKRACVIGWPIEHSRSPLIHNYWIKQYKLDAEYGRKAVKPEELAGFVRSLRERGYVGCNVTRALREADARVVCRGRVGDVYGLHRSNVTRASKQQAELARGQPSPDRTTDGRVEASTTRGPHGVVRDCLPARRGNGSGHREVVQLREGLRLHRR